MIRCAFSGNQRDIRTDERIDLVDIIVVVICAVLSGAEGWEAIKE